MGRPSKLGAVPRPIAGRGTFFFLRRVRLCLADRFPGGEKQRLMQQKSCRRVLMLVWGWCLWFFLGAGGWAMAAELEGLTTTPTTTATEQSSKTGELEDQTTVLDAVEVTSEKVETGDVDKTLTPGFFSVIKREDFQGRLENLADVIEKEAGTQVLQHGGMGSYSSISLRGSSSDQVMIYLDGILLNEGSGGGVNLSNFSLGDVGSIEVFRGTTPVNFGKASIGGVVNIKTIKAEEGAQRRGLHWLWFLPYPQGLGLYQSQAGQV